MVSLPRMKRRKLQMKVIGQLFQSQTKKINDNVEIQVSDSGKGIRKDIADKSSLIFYYQTKREGDRFKIEFELRYY
ncbi:MAG: hypothetical protein ABI691_01310 [Ginsengibacter sp.]